MAGKHRLFSAGFKAIAATRADRWLRPLAQGAGLILTFHRVRPWAGGGFAPNRLLEVTPEFLEATLRVLRREGFEIVPLDEAPARLRRREPKPFAVLTFDDGYRDNLEHAAPVLERHEAPWTLFVTTDFADGRGRLWWIELEQAIARLARVRLEHADGALELPARTAAEKTVAFDAVYRRLRAGPEEVLRAAVAVLLDEAGLHSAALCSELCLSWSELAALARRPGLTIGAHTLTHPILAKHDEATARREIGEGRRIVAERLGVPVHHFAYPIGDTSSAGPREFRLAAEAGYTTAVTTRPGHLFDAHLKALNALPRVSVNGLFQSEAALRALVSGVPFLAWNLGRVARAA